MKVTVIPIDLGYNIDDIIREGVEEITGEAKKELDLAIDLAKQRDALATQQKSKKQDSDNAINEALEKVYNNLIEAKDEGLECDMIIESLKNYIPNASGFTLRMKKFLRDKGNPYTISRIKIQGKQHYVFNKYNITE